MNTETAVRNLEGNPPTSDIGRLAEIVERGSDQERVELQRHCQYLIKFADEMEAGLKQLREVISKLGEDGGRSPMSEAEDRP